MSVSIDLNKLRVTASLSLANFFPTWLLAEREFRARLLSSRFLSISLRGIASDSTRPRPAKRESRPIARIREIFIRPLTADVNVVQMYSSAPIIEHRIKCNPCADYYARRTQSVLFILRLNLHRVRVNLGCNNRAIRNVQSSTRKSRYSLFG